MKIFGIQFNVKREPRQGQRIAVIEASLANQGDILKAVVEQLDLVGKKAEATRRKVYREAELPGGEPPGPAPAPVPVADPWALLKPGDPPPM